MASDDLANETMRSPDEIENKLNELRETPSTLSNGSSGLDDAYRTDGKMKALCWVLGGDHDL